MLMQLHDSMQRVFYLWRNMKSLVYEEEFATQKQLLQRIHNAAESIQHGGHLQELIQSWLRCVILNIYCNCFSLFQLNIISCLLFNLIKQSYLYIAILFLLTVAVGQEG